MTKPDDIPQDVWNAAVDWIHNDWDEPAQTVARAIMAEREACAQIADSQDGGAIECEQIAAAIRSRGAA